MMDSKHPGTKMIYQFSLDDCIPKDHFLRLVEDLVDLSFVRDSARVFYSDRGAPSVDPVVIFKMLLLGYFYGISSERRSAEECRYNLAFKCSCVLSSKGSRRQGITCLRLNRVL